jgi:hypothetical protein
VFIDRATAGEPKLWCCEGAAGWAQCSGAGGDPSSGQYHPDRAPSTGLVAASSDDFAGGFEATWRWGNQGTSTDVVNYDSALLGFQHGSGSISYRVRWVDAPTTGDWIIAAKLRAVDLAGNQTAGGLCVLVTGTEATPTLIHTVELIDATNDGFYHRTATSYTASGATVGSITSTIFNPSFIEGFLPIYLAAKFLDGTDALTTYYSVGGLDWVQVGTTTLAGNPTSVGRCGLATISDDGAIRTDWFRTCTSPACVDDLEVGE